MGTAKNKLKANGDAETMGMRIKALLKSRNESQGSVARALGVTGAAVSSWVNDDSDPTPVNLILLADYLGVSVRFLVLGRVPRIPGDRRVPYLARRNGRLLNVEQDLPLTANGD